MRIALSYSWSLPAGDVAQVREIMERLRQHAVELGGDAGEVVVLIGDEAEAVQSRMQVAVFFSATMPGTTEGKYGLASPDNYSWSWDGAVVVSDVRKVSELHAAAAALGLQISECYAGMIFTSKKNAQGVVEVVQRTVIDWSNF